MTKTSNMPDASGEAGVPCELEVVEGAFHGFDMGSAPVVQDFHRSQIDALSAAFDQDPAG